VDNHTVLVVEDDPVILELLSLNFSMEGFEVRTAEDGEVALAEVAAQHPDVIVMDIMMPKVTGLEAVARLKADDATAGIPIILLSAKAQSSDVQAGLDAGADLVDRVERLLAPR
jgi:DNA-binding response OmpR family regulator